MTHIRLHSLQTQHVFVVILILGLFTLAIRPATDPDLGWHLRTGEIIAYTQQVLHADPYSFTRAGQPWINHEWLSDLFLYGLYRLGGMSALIVVFGAIGAAAFLFVFARSPGKPYLAGAITVWGALAASPSYGVRPQIISLLLASLFLWLLECSENKPRILWWMIPLTLLWVNLHAEFAVGIALIALFLAGVFLDFSFGFASWIDTAPRMRNLALSLAACLAVVPLNPYGLKMYLYPWHTLSSPAMAAYIQEWASPDFHQAIYLPLLLLVLALLAAAAISPLHLKPRELLLLIIMLFAGLRSVRHIPIFALVAAPILARLVHALLQQCKIHLHPETEPRKARLFLNGAILAGFLVFVILRSGSVIRREPQAEAKQFPVQAVAFLAQNKLPGPLFNHYNWGGYLIWKLYPQYKVFVDGRADLYGDKFLDDLASMYFVQGQWKQAFEPWQIQTVLLPANAPLIAALRLQPGWQQVYADKQAVILTRRKAP